MWVKDTQARKNGRLDVKELVDTPEDNGGWEGDLREKETNVN